MALRWDVPKRQVARDFGIIETTLHRWIRQHEIGAGRRDGATPGELAELRVLRETLAPAGEPDPAPAAYFAKDVLANYLSVRP